MSFEIALTRDIPSRIFVQGNPINVFYRNQPRSCFVCGLLGHEAKLCPKKQRVTRPPPAADPHPDGPSSGEPPVDVADTTPSDPSNGVARPSFSDVLGGLEAAVAQPAAQTADSAPSSNFSDPPGSSLQRPSLVSPQGDGDPRSDSMDVSPDVALLLQVMESTPVTLAPRPELPPSSPDTQLPASTQVGGSGVTPPEQPLNNSVPPQDVPSASPPAAADTVSDSPPSSVRGRDRSLSSSDLFSSPSARMKKITHKSLTKPAILHKKRVSARKPLAAFIRTRTSPSPLPTTTKNSTSPSSSIESPNRFQLLSYDNAPTS